jgi:error-prone DNA polymerase
VLIRQRPGSAKGVCFITLEDETGIANLVIWPDVFEAQRKIVMGARLMVVHGIIQRDDQQPDCPQQSGTGHDIIHVVVRKLEDGTHMLRHLSDGLLPSTLNQGDGGGSWRQPAGRHPRDVSVIPKSRDFH